MQSTEKCSMMSYKRTSGSGMGKKENLMEWCSSESYYKGNKVRKLCRPKLLMKMGEVYLYQIIKRKKTRKNIPNSKQIISNYKGRKDSSNDDLQMMDAGFLFSIVTTEINAAGKRRKA